MKYEQIPENIRAAARQAGLSAPLWYCGPHIDPNKPRKKTLADLAAQAQARCSPQPLGEHLGNPATGKDSARSNPENTRPAGVLWGGGRR